VVNNGLLQNSFANIILIIIGLSIAGMLYTFMKITQNYCQYNKVSSEGNEEVFIQDNNGWNNSNANNNNNET